MLFSFSGNNLDIKDDVNDDDDSSRADGFRLLLGDDIVELLDASAWENESVRSDTESTTTNETKTTIIDHQVPSRQEQQTQQHHTPSQQSNRLNLSSHIDDKYNDFLFSLSYTTNDNNKIGRPQLKIVNLGPDKGNGLIALQDFSKGTVLYTERAAIATLADYSSSVTCCFNCFQSLEYITVCRGLLQEPSTTGRLTDTAVEIENGNGNKDFPEFPCPNLWPVLPLAWNDDLEETSKFRLDRYGRRQCNECGKLFCSIYCQNVFEDEFGSCCLLSHAIRGLPEAFRLDETTSNQLVGDIGEFNDDDSDDIQCAVLLAIRMFAHELHLLRSTTSNGKNKSYLTGLCGIESELNELQIGCGSRSIQYDNKDDAINGDVIITYTLKPIFKHLIEIYSLSDDEVVELPYSKLELFAVQAARNGFGITSQSPFQSYYNSLIRVSGRGTTKHDDVVRQVTASLGVQKFDRTMDATIDRRVAPQLAAIFPLTARINHACSTNYNAEVRSGQFVNYNIDVVATHNIQAGEEILISYIEGSHRKTRHKRQLELNARYLFNCKCYSCQK